MNKYTKGFDRFLRYHHVLEKYEIAFNNYESALWRESEDIDHHQLSDKYNFLNLAFSWMDNDDDMEVPWSELNDLWVDAINYDDRRFFHIEPLNKRIHVL